MNTTDLALKLELMMMFSEGSELKVTSSDLGLHKNQIAESVLTNPIMVNFVDFRGISNPKRWAIYQSNPMYECLYLEDPYYQDPRSDVDDPSSIDSISEFDLEDY